tara:strand:- start:566 stop:832 length:267 start_codon:yes stop_codon:yes gene_type:complete
MLRVAEVLVVIEKEQIIKLVELLLLQLVLEVLEPFLVLVLMVLTLSWLISHQLEVVAVTIMHIAEPAVMVVQVAVVVPLLVALLEEMV